MEWKNKKVVLLRLENVLASFPKGKCKPQDVTDIRLEANILDALKTMPSLCRLVILYDDFEPLHEKERLALVKGIEFFLFCLLSVAVESKGPEQRHVGWFDGLDENVIQLVHDTSRESSTELMRMKGTLDCLIPRGSKRLIQAVVENASVPVIETGSGNCHIYVDESADINMAANIIFNAKTQRIGVCNACESLVIHENIIKKALPAIKARLDEKNVTIRGDEKAREVCPGIEVASEEDFGTEYLDYIISVKTVSSLDEAIEHINKYSTGHSEAIITENKENADKFMMLIDSSSVYHNASTRFTDGGEFGLGAEIGISTQKLHARGPMGLRELTTTKYLVYGDGQIR